MLDDDYGYDLGQYKLPVTTNSDIAQGWFNRGLNWTYGFNHTEAIACFMRALDHDPDCAMAHWGIAYATGPNYNMPWDLYRKFALESVLKTCPRFFSETMP